jgi:hypothetical protein
VILAEEMTKGIDVGINEFWTVLNDLLQIQDLTES